ncbi:hypothetical protein [Halorussus marinus]|uniref:hypothetical protein n=1 Tax=Halorussus marinus TaxID=2505976 RepID=UPI00106EBBED|nr:hypothetical protein [Halorussus marinus]
MRRNDATDPADAPGPDALGDRETASGEPWVLRDEEFLSEADREYVVRDDGWPWLSSLSALAVGALVGLLVADVTAILAATASGRDALAFLPPAIAAVGLRGLLAAKVGVAAVLVVATTGTCSGRHRRAGALPDALVGVAGFIAVVGGVALV